MAYMRSSWGSQDGRFRIEKRYYAHRALPADKSLRERRAPRTHLTKPSQIEVNRRLRAEQLTRLQLDNFVAGDWYLTCTCRERMEPAQLSRAFEQFKRRLRAIYKKAGVPMRYISVLENLTGAGRPHGHILLPALPQGLLEKVQAAWRCGNVGVKLYGGHLRDAERLADYFTKEKIAAHAGQIMPSKNLIRREPRKTKVTRAQVYKQEIMPPKGYRLIKDLSYTTTTAEGYPLVIAYFERIAPGGGSGGEVRHGQEGLCTAGSDALRARADGAAGKELRSARRNESNGAIRSEES